MKIKEGLLPCTKENVKRYIESTIEHWTNFDVDSIVDGAVVAKCHIVTFEAMFYSLFHGDYSFSVKTVKLYLDTTKRFWVLAQNEEEMAVYYIDALDSIQKSLFGGK